MRPITVTVGPLAAATATKIATAQRNFGAGGALALLGAASNFVAGTVAATQAPRSSALTINGTLANTGVAYLPNQYIYITSSGDDHARTWAVVGLVGPNLIRVTETIAGTNAQSSASVNAYNQILSITPSGAIAANATVGTFSAATLDTPRRVLITTTADETLNTATITGTTFGGAAATETITLVNNNTVSSVLDYLTVTKVTIASAAAGNISVGTSGVAGSAWVSLDPWSMSQVAIQCTASGTVNYTLQQTLDDPNSLTNPVTPANVTWVNTNDTGAVGATGTIQTNYAYAPVFARVLLNSGSGSVVTTFVQADVVTR